MSDQSRKIVLASGNAGKIREFNHLFEGENITVVGQKELGIDDAVEDGLSFVENAIKKARHASKHSGLAALADDSGIEVDVLDGAPGIYSARFAGPDASDADNVDKLLRELEGVETRARTARFQCVIVYMRHWQDPTPAVFQGAWEGIILDKPQGENGFGYDPVFWVPSHECSAAELSSDEKNRISHRGRALRKFMAFSQDQAL